MSSSAWYRPGNFYLIRVPTLPITLFSDISACGSIDSQSPTLDQDQWQHVRQSSLRSLRRMSQLPLVEQAIQVASTSLHEVIYCKMPHWEEDTHTVRAIDRFMRYFIRMCTRATPFGICAGVAFGHFAPHTQHAQIEIQAGMDMGIRPDMAWLHHIITPLEADLLSQLLVQLTPSLCMQGKRGVGLEVQPREAGRQEAKHYEERVWFKCTPVIELLHNHAHMPVLYAGPQADGADRVPSGYQRHD